VLDAVRQFQSANGVGADGVVGAGTRRLLNQGQQSQPQAAANPARMREILVNMERWRWLPHDLGPYYVTVNIPEFMLYVVEEGKIAHSTRVVVGKPDKQTPVLSDEMEEVVFNPYWNVPNSIKNEEIAPYMGQGGGLFGGWDTSILHRHNLRIRIGNRDVDPDAIDWSRNDIRNFDLVQPPGPDNVLGRVKFVFPNSHDVYMHDTTQKFLFNNPVRAESHGCMRVQNPEELAHVLLKHDKGWTAAKVDSMFDAGGDYHLALDQKIPVYITYFTLHVNDDGSLTSFNDIYGHDSRIASVLEGRGYVPEPETDDQVVAGDWRPDGSGPRRAGQKGPFGSDFTRGLFGF